MLRRLFIILLTLGLLVHPSVAQPNSSRNPPALPPNMKKMEGKYHILIYDIPEEQARDVMLRMQVMFEEYQNRTKDFSGKIHEKLPFYLFKNSDDYFKAGGLKGSDGVFMGDRLMAIAGQEINSQTWHTIQHEGFHQFADAVIGGDIPVWVNEGLAEYFGEAIYTGDRFVTGVIPNWRMRRIQHELADGRFMTLTEIMQQSLEQWNSNINITNYDQAWSMVQYLAHGEAGKYTKPFNTFMQLLNRGTPYERAWRDSFGNIEGMEGQWQIFWKELPVNNTVDLYAEAVTQMLTSYLGRATLQRQTFKDVNELIAAINEQKIKQNPKDTLPASLYTDCRRLIEDLQREKYVFELTTQPTLYKSQPAIQCTFPNGKKMFGTYRVSAGKIEKVETMFEKTKQVK